MPIVLVIAAGIALIIFTSWAWLGWVLVIGSVAFLVLVVGVLGLLLKVIAKQPRLRF